MRTWWTALLTLGLALAPGCGGDDDDDTAGIDGAIAGDPDAAASQPDAASPVDAPPTPDAEPATSCTQSPLAPQDDSSAAGVFDLVISEISIDGDFVEIYNDTDAAIHLTTLTGYVWCTLGSYPFVTADDVTVPAKGYATIPYPLSIGANAAGELVLYANIEYTNASSVLDYVCWGSGGTIRKTTAETAGKWSGACAPAIPGGGSLQRKPSTAGEAAADYEALGTPTPEDNCTTQ